MKQTPRLRLGRSITTTALFALTALLVPESGATLSGKKIGLDPGHGAGVNPGVYIAEGTWVLDAAFRARTHLQNDGAQVVMTRTTGADPSLATRYNLLNSNNCNLSVIIHSNAASAAADGIETYYCSLSYGSSSQNLATDLRLRALSMVRNDNRGTKECLDAGRGFHFAMVRYTNMPSSLPEYYFHTNAWENGNIHNTTSGRENVAKSLYAGVCDYYGQTPVFGSQPGSGGIIIDNSSGNFSASSNWTTSTSVSGYYGSNYHTRATTDHSDVATWSFTIKNRGDYEVLARWTAHPNRATSIPYVVDHASGSTFVYVDQTTNGGQWNSLGTYLFGDTGPTNHTVRLSCWTTTGDYVVADAIWIVPKKVWVDNHHDGFQASGNWSVSSVSTDRYGPNYAYRSTQPISDPATWTVEHLTAGTYQIHAWWTAHPNRSASAPYIVHDSGGTDVVNVNQRTNGGQWNSLGSYTLGSGQNKVQLSCWTSSGDIVVADAIRWTLQ